MTEKDDRRQAIIDYLVGYTIGALVTIVTLGAIKFIVNL